MTFVRQRLLAALSPWLLPIALAVTLLTITPASAGDAPGMRVYRDPSTGEFTAPPIDANADVPTGAARAEALTGAPSDLLEESGTSAAGGVTLDLQGRFQADESATIDANGAVHTHCHSGTDAESRR